MMTLVWWILAVVVGSGCMFALGYVCCFINLTNRLGERVERQRQKREANKTPPCPESLLAKLRQPVTRTEFEDVPAEPGTVWEVVSPTGEILLFVLVERVEDPAPEVPLVFRGVPVGEHVRLAAEGDVVCTVPTQPPMVIVAHVWLEGPILPSSLRKSVGRLSPADWQNVQKTRPSMGGSQEGFVAAYRESLFEQFDPVYNAAWGELPID